MKKNNKGFSLVELIIVIAIMAILAGALAPALIKYIAKSRKSTDVSNAQTIATAITNALSVETAYDSVNGGASFTIKDSAKTNTHVAGNTSFASEVNSQLGNTKYAPKYEKDESFDITLGSTKDSFTIEINGHEVYPDVDAYYK